MPLRNYFEMFIVFCSVTAKTGRITYLDLHNLLIETVKCSVLEEKNFQAEFHEQSITGKILFSAR